jgi:predicted MPP superfamily phosphohydrolase
MRLLHLSDIHFREPDCLNPLTDPELPYRSRLLSDLVPLCNGKTVDAILVGGDIAFKAHPTEFQVATVWLKDLANRIGCRYDRIYVVPGNHDVDRDTCRKSVVIANAQGAIAQAKPYRREATLRAQLQDSDAGAALFKPLAAYNDFASPFGCYVSPGKPYWTYTLDDFGCGVTLRLHGLTSTMISGLEDRDDAPGGKLYLSPLQTVLNPEPDVLNLVMSHHPPHWFLDSDEVDDAVNARAPLQFFGHEHRQRCVQTPGYVRFTAGALHPDRYENGWKPGYNLIDLDVLGQGQQRLIQVRAHVRQLQKYPERFIAVASPSGHDVWTSEILFPSHASHVICPAQAQPAATAEGSTIQAVPATVVSDAEVAMSSPNTKGLVYRFWRLDDSQKRDIMLKLNLITEGDLWMSDADLYDRGLRLAAQRGLLEELALHVKLLDQNG